MLVIHKVRIRAVIDFSKSVLWQGVTKNKESWYEIVGDEKDHEKFCSPRDVSFSRVNATDVISYKNSGTDQRQLQRRLSEPQRFEVEPEPELLRQ